MSSTPVRRSCLRALQQSARVESRASNGSRQTAHAAITSRKFSSTRIARDEPSAKTTASNSDSFQNLASRLRSSSALNATTEPYVAYGSTQSLFKLCTQAGDYSMPSNTSTDVPKPTTSDGQELGMPGPNTWYDRYTLLPVFNTWAQLAMLHMYILTVRIRMFPADHARHWHQNLLDHFFYACEDRMAAMHGIEARSVRNKYLKDLFVQWRGVLAAYDEGLVKGDAMLAAAVWRNIFNGREDVDAVQLAEVTAWLRAQLKYMEGLSDKAVADARVEFGSPSRMAEVVGRKSRGLTEKLE